MAPTIGFLLYPRLTQLDLTGPYEVLSHLPGADIRLVWKTLGPVDADKGMQISADTAFAECPQLDILCVPGGPGQIDLMDDHEVLSFLRRQTPGARFVTAVCTGSLLLGAAGLLDGYRATTHWAMTDLLGAYGAIHENGRVIIDGNRITAAGVSAGIDFALSLVTEIAGAKQAQLIQLGIEYHPDPPFTSGHPDVADPKIVETMRSLMTGVIERRAAQADGYVRGKS